ncbi:serine protease Do [Limimaricola soesokkakensis]|uniref:Probable periplasmic serine endoprotease DegP-like n=1 Tax=Limimaricola soesokkakensis TaxID=1343159 RepID=A0A1X6Y7U1_9RHOB|nr:serine protease Do [Limimaricola soesokkakensis]SLN13538.1 putative periplasmic serine endoprotease DegP-like precursor [Limimaricola soesokkakensis]
MNAKTNSTSLVTPVRAVSVLALGAALGLGQVAPLAAQDTAVTPETEAQTMADAPDATRPLTFADLAEQVSPAVVNITTSTMVSAPAGPQGIVPEGSPFEEFFRDFQNRGDSAPRRSSALGSGFVISADGYVVTNNHVIDGADEINIEFFSGKTLKAEVVGTDASTDIALLKVEGEDLPYVEFGDSTGQGARVGDWVMAMGNPLGQGFSVSAGIVSARGRALSGTYDDYIQTDAAINRGNSGGPLFNMSGEVIGVNTAILSPNGGSIGIGFAMSSDVVTEVVGQLQEFGETRRGWLGVRIQDVTPDMVEAIEGLEGAAGALVTDVPEGPAMEAGMEAGDVIVSFDGNEVPDTRDLVRMVGRAPVGEEVPVTVLRDGEMVELAVTLGRREDAESAVPASAQGSGEGAETEMFGLSLSELTPELRQQLDLAEDAEGLVVTDVDPASDAAEKGVAAGDVITEAGQQPVASVADFEARVEEAREAGRKSLLLLVRRAGDPRFVALGLEDTAE